MISIYTGVNLGTDTDTGLAHTPDMIFKTELEGYVKDGGTTTITAEVLYNNDRVGRAMGLLLEMLRSRGIVSNEDVADLLHVAQIPQ